MKILAESEYKQHKKSTLYKAQHFARQFSKDEFAELCELRGPTGRPLTWQHVVRLLPIRDKSVRKELMRAAAANGWSPRDLALQVQQRGVRPRRRGDGRPVRKPASTEAALWRVLGDSETWLRVHSTVLGKERSRVADQISRATECGTVELAEKLISALETMHSAIEQDLKELRQALRQGACTGEGRGSTGRDAA